MVNALFEIDNDNLTVEEIEDYINRTSLNYNITKKGLFIYNFNDTDIVFDKLEDIIGNFDKIIVYHSNIELMRIYNVNYDSVITEDSIKEPTQVDIDELNNNIKPNLEEPFNY